MRTQKVTDCSYSWYYDEINDSSFYDEVTTVNKPTTRYFYDGQMACEEDFAEIVPSEDPFFEVTRYGLGARGIDWIEKATVEDTSISFPIYDGHGNVIAQLGRTGSSFSLTQVKRYDVWGGVRSGALGPAGRYCGNLGHVSDDESGLIYMRARYYEPGSGRFISEDPAMDGLNWYAYCGNDPVSFGDYSGKHPVGVMVLAGLVVGAGAAAYSIVNQWMKHGWDKIVWNDVMESFVGGFVGGFGVAALSVFGSAFAAGSTFAAAAEAVATMVSAKTFGFALAISLGTGGVGGAAGAVFSLFSSQFQAGLYLKSMMED